VKIRNGGGNGIGTGIGGWHRVRTMVRVFDPAKSQRAVPGWVNNSGRSNDSPQGTKEMNNLPAINRDEALELSTTMSITLTDCKASKY
jgi:hypothetical protein